MNNNINFDVAVLIGRFQPFHNGHQALLNLALQTAARVIVVLGSSCQARNAKNPFTWQERASMIASTLNEVDQKRVSFAPVRDYYDDKLWCAAVRRAVSEREGMRNIVLTGFHKDASSNYLIRFPDWSYIEAPQIEQIDATNVRQIYFANDPSVAMPTLLSRLLPDTVVAYLNEWMQSPHFEKMKQEHLAIAEGVRKWGNGPFITVDAVVTASKHVLLVRRGGALGHGLRAMPGGFLELQERLLQGALRELKEETGLLVHNMEQFLKEVAVFDHPGRSLRGRTITHAHWFDLGDVHLPEVAGADDAADAKWIPIADLSAMEAEFFEDHFRILNYFLHIAEP
jgi:bifunctional NMN adenylyltransferase/nudix hydrolase